MKCKKITKLLNTGKVMHQSLIVGFFQEISNASRIRPTKLAENSIKYM